MSILLNPKTLISLIDPFVRIYFSDEDKMVDKKKTKIKKKTLDPIFQETFIFELSKCQGPSIKEIGNLEAEKDQNVLEICRSTPKDKIKNCCKLNFIVMDWDLMPPDEVSLKFIHSKKAIKISVNHPL